MDNCLPTKLARWLVALAAGSIAITAAPQLAVAIPAFARKYETSCQTCHTAFPDLNAFGQAFRHNGYRYPAGEDDDATSDEDVDLGHEATKKMFPDTVWPGAIPGSFPGSVTLSGLVRYIDEPEPEADVGGLGGRFGLITGAALGNVFSVWGGAAINASIADDGTEEFEAELERLFVSIQPFDRPHAMFRIGRFEPELAGVSMHRTLGPAPWLLSRPVGDNAFRIEPAQLGVEAAGIAAGRLKWVGGLIEARGNAFETPNDLFGRVAYKFGGMRMDGVGGAKAARPWRDDTVRLGAFGLYGSETIGDETASQDDEFYTLGADVLARWWDLEWKNAYARTRYDRPLLRDPTRSLTTHQLYSQLKYFWYPWLIPAGRVEWRETAIEDSETRLAPGAYVLIRPNVRAQLIGMWEFQSGNLRFDQGIAGINTAF